MILKIWDGLRIFIAYFKLLILERHDNQYALQLLKAFPSIDGNDLICLLIQNTFFH